MSKKSTEVRVNKNPAHFQVLQPLGVNFQALNHFLNKGYEPDSDEEVAESQASKRQKKPAEQSILKMISSFQDNNGLPQMVVKELGIDVDQENLQPLLPDPRGFTSSTGFHPPEYIAPLVALGGSENED